MAAGKNAESTRHDAILLLGIGRSEQLQTWVEGALEGVPHQYVSLSELPERGELPPGTDPNMGIYR